MIEKISAITTKTVVRTGCGDFEAISLKSLLTILSKIDELVEAVNRLEQGEKQPETKPVIETEYIDKGGVFDTMYDLLFDEKRIPTKQDILAVIENAPAERVVKNG